MKNSPGHRPRACYNPHMLVCGCCYLSIKSTLVYLFFDLGRCPGAMAAESCSPDLPSTSDRSVSDFNFCAQALRFLNMFRDRRSRAGHCIIKNAENARTIQHKSHLLVSCHRIFFFHTFIWPLCCLFCSLLCGCLPFQKCRKR